MIKYPKCPKCESNLWYETPSCPMCGFDLKEFKESGGFEIKFNKESDGSQFFITQDAKLPPWYDGGDDVLVDKKVNPKDLGKPFEIYYYEPFIGYGQIRFSSYGIGFLFPKSIIDGPRYSLESILVSEIRKAINQGEFGNSLINEIPVKEIYEIQLDGRTLEIIHMIENLGLFIIRFSLQDGERLYRDLYKHYPHVVSEWKNQIEKLLANDKKETNE